jgi:hypothetical protein
MMSTLRNLMLLATSALLAPACVIQTVPYEQHPQPPPRRRSHKPPPSARRPPVAPAQPTASPAGRPVGPAPATTGRLTSPPPQPLEAQPAKDVPPSSSGDPARMPEGAGTGRPPGFRPGAPAAYWIWQGPRGGWRIRTTTLGKPHVFRGRIRGATGEVTNVQPSRVEFRDRVWRERDGSWAFSMRTSAHADGLTFVTQDNGCVVFDLQLDGGPETKKIFVGRGELQPSSSFFVVCPKGMSPTQRPARPGPPPRR